MRALLLYAKNNPEKKPLTICPLSLSPLLDFTGKVKPGTRRFLSGKRRLNALGSKLKQVQIPRAELYVHLWKIGGSLHEKMPKILLIKGSRLNRYVIQVYFLLHQVYRTTKSIVVY